MPKSIIASNSVLLAPLFAILLWPAPAEATRTRTVDCAAGDSVQQRLDAAVASAAQGEAVIINIASDCRQSVVISGDNVTLRTKPGISRVRIRGTITADAAQRFVITDLRITGGGSGIVATNGASGQIADVRTQDNEEAGIRVTQGANVEILRSKIDENGRGAPFFDSGLEISGAATVFSAGNTIEDNAFAAVSVRSLGVFRNGRRDIDGPPPSRDRDTYVQRGCIVGASPGCGADASAVFDIDTRGLAELRNAFVTGRLLVQGVSTLEMETSIISGDIAGFDRSGLNISLSVRGDGELLCSSDSFSYGVEVYRCGADFDNSGTSGGGREFPVPRPFPF